MELNGTYQALAELLREVDDKLQSVSADDIRGKHLTKDLGLDSLDVIKFVLLVEEKYGVKLADEEIDGKGLLEVDNLAGYIGARGA